MAWSETSKQSVRKTKGSAVIAGLSDIVGSLGREETKFYELEVAEILDICLDSEHEAFEALGGYSNGAIGQVKIRLLHSNSKEYPGNYDKGTVGRQIWARPLVTNLKTYPLLREYVIVGQYLSKLTPNSQTLLREYYYSSPLSMFGSVNSNAFLLDRSQPPVGSKDYSEIEDGQEQTAGSEEKVAISLGKEFSPSTVIKPVLPREGDVILEGRFGQSLRFGSPDGNIIPSIYLRAGQAEPEEEMEYLKPMDENINLDGASIYMTIDEAIPLDFSSTALSAASASATIPDEFSGKQIILNSDTVVLNSRDGTLVGMAKNGIGFSTEGDITLDATGTTTVASPVINLGFEAEEPVVLGNQLEEILLGILDEIGKMVDAITAMSVPTGTGPSGPPVNSPQFLSVKTVGLKAIENKLENIKSKQNFTK
jgi:hypothetical protein